METKAISMPAEVGTIISRLNDNGFQAYIVGGCVRDSILGKQPPDWDITTNAKPEAVKELFSKTYDTGIEHGTITVVVNQNSFEVTTYRIDGEYIGNRRPASVEFTSSLSEDLSRRDFTVNAIAYHPSEGLLDPFNGLQDISLGIIRAVGDANHRFNEDALRMLRAVRFSAQLDFSIEGKTFESIKQNSHLIQNISRERVRTELSKILVSDHPEKFALLKDAGLLKYILPEFEKCFEVDQNHPYHIYNVAFHSLKAVSCISNSEVLRWTMLLHDTGKAETRTTDKKGIDHFYGHPYKSVRLAGSILNRLRFDKKSISRICRLIEYHDRDIMPTSKAVRKAVKAAGADIFEDLLKVKEADKRAQNPEAAPKRLVELNQIRKIYDEIIKNKECLNLKDLALDGTDLINMGFKPGKEIGLALNKLLDCVVENPEMNTREQLADLARDLRSSIRHSGNVDRV